MQVVQLVDVVYMVALLVVHHLLYRAVGGRGIYVRSACGAPSAISCSWWTWYMFVLLVVHHLLYRAVGGRGIDVCSACGAPSAISCSWWCLWYWYSALAAVPCCILVPGYKDPENRFSSDTTIIGLQHRRHQHHCSQYLHHQDQ